MTDDEKQAKHLEMIEAVIARLAGNSFTIKGWSTALVSALLAFLAKDGDPTYAWIALVPALVFWTLDAYYLGLERAFRDLYDAVRGGAHHDYAMEIENPKLLWRRRAVALPHGMLVFVTLLVWATSCL